MTDEKRDRLTSEEIWLGATDDSNDEKRNRLVSEVIWLGIVSASYLDDKEGTFMFQHPEKLLAIHFAVLLTERFGQQHLTVAEIIDKYDVRNGLESVRSGRCRRNHGPSVLTDVLEQHASKNFHRSLCELLTLHSGAYSGDNLLRHSNAILTNLFYADPPPEMDVQPSPDSSLSQQGCENTAVIEMMSELSIIVLRLLSAVLNSRPLQSMEKDRVLAEGIKFHESLGLRKTILAINERRSSTESLGYLWSPEKVLEDWTKNPQAFSAFHSIDYHAEGAQIVLPLWRKLASRIYVVFAFVIAVLTAALNFGSRDTAFERITDGLEVATAMLVTVFGLLKLASEDPNAIRNSLLGIKVLKTAEDVAKECGFRDIEHLKFVMTLADKPVRWASDHQTSYLKHRPTGSMIVPGGLAVGQKGKWPIYTFGDRLMNGDSPFGVLITASSYGTASASRTHVKLPFLCVFPTKVVRILCSKVARCVQEQTSFPCFSQS